MKTIYLVRHGEQQKTPGEPSLSELGVQQAQKAGEYLKNFPITKIYSSPIVRTQETATHISQILNLPFELDVLLKERVNWGDDPEQSFEDFDSMWKKASVDREWQPQVGDSSINSGKRLEKFISKILSDPEEHVVIVTHGGLTADFLKNVFSTEDLNEHIEEFAQLSDGKVKHCSITTIEVDPETGAYTLVSLADVDHLA